MKMLVGASVLFILLVTGALTWWLQSPTAAPGPAALQAPRVARPPPPPSPGPAVSPPAAADPPSPVAQPLVTPVAAVERGGEVALPMPVEAPALLLRARAEVAEAPEATLRTLRQLERVAPDVASAPTTGLIRLEALLRLGQREEAERLARRLMDTPSREVKPRDVQRLLDETPAK